MPNVKKSSVNKSTSTNKKLKNETKKIEKKEEKIENEIPIKIIEKEEQKRENNEIQLPIREKKTKIIQIVLLFIFVVAIFIVIFLFANSKFTFNKIEKMENSLTKVGKSFYSDFYYEQISVGKTDKEVENFLSQFKEVGIKISLENLEKYKNDDNANDIKILSDGECDKEKTQVTIYPNQKYGKTDFTIKIKLECDTLK